MTEEFSQWLASQGLTESGAYITEHSAINIPTVYACVRVLAESMACMPLMVYARGENGKTVAVNHPLYHVLHDEPNREMTSFTWRETMMAHLCLWGNAYSEIQFNMAGQPCALWPLRPDWMTVRRDFATGNLVYTFTSPYTGVHHLDPAQVLHIPGLSFDGQIGYSPISIQREGLGLSAAAQDYAARFFGNDSTPGGYLVTAAPMMDEKKKIDMAKAWVDAHSGHNQHKIAILDGGLDYKSIALNADDAQLLATREFQRSEIAGWYRVPAHKINDLTHATFSNVEHLGMEFVTDALMPWAVRWEQELNRMLFASYKYFAEFKMDVFMRGDMASRYAAYSVGRQWGWFSANDVRALENMNPLPDGKGDIYMMPMNMIPSGQIAVPAVGRSVVEPVLSDAFDHIAKRESEDVLKEARKLLAVSDVQGFSSWLADYMVTSLETFVKQRLSAPIASTIRAIGNGNGVDAATVEAFAAVQARRYSLSEGAALMIRVVQAESEKQDLVFAVEDFYANRSSLALANDVMTKIEAEIAEVHRG
jgi:HK97 family phage portal protein